MSADKKTIESDIKAREKDKSAAINSLDDISKQVAKLKSDFESTNDILALAIERTNLERNRLKAEIMNLNNEKNRIKNEIDTLNIESAKNDKAKIYVEIEKAKRELASVEEKKVSSENAYKSLQAEIGALGTSTAKIREENEKIIKEYNLNKHVNDATLAEIEAKKSEMKKIEERLDRKIANVHKLIESAQVDKALSEKLKSSLK